MPDPTMAQLNARIEDLPFGLAGLVRGAMRQPGTTSDHLLHLADAMDEARRDILVVLPGGCAEADHYVTAAEILRDAAPLFTPPPRVPANALDACPRISP